MSVTVTDTNMNIMKEEKLLSLVDKLNNDFKEEYLSNEISFDKYLCYGAENLRLGNKINIKYGERNILFMAMGFTSNKEKIVAILCPIDNIDWYPMNLKFTNEGGFEKSFMKNIALPKIMHELDQSNDYIFPYPITLFTEQNFFGKVIYTEEIYTDSVDNNLLPIFKFISFKKFLDYSENGEDDSSFWLRDVGRGSSCHFVLAGDYGIAYYSSAASSRGVRPRLMLI